MATLTNQSDNPNIISDNLSSSSTDQPDESQNGHSDLLVTSVEGETVVSPATPSAESILNQCNYLIKEAKNFNLHANILKKLLNLKERSSGYDLYARRKLVDSGANSGQSETEVDPAVEMESLLKIINDLRREVEESHRLGFCLAYNIQCLQKRLTGSPIDLNSGANLIRSLQEKYESFKTREAILKYEFQEKRKLLRRLRHQLEETREDWRLLRVRRRRPEDEQDDLLWSEQLRREFASKRKQPSEESGFNESRDVNFDGASTSSDPPTATTSGSEASDSTSYDDLAIALDNRRARITSMEDECYNLFDSLAARGSDLSRSHAAEANSEYRSSVVLAPTLLLPSDLAEGLLEVEGDLSDDEDVDDDDDPLSDEFDELNLPLDNLNPLEPVDNTEEADMSDLPWDNNNLYESRTNSIATESIFPVNSAEQALVSTSLDGNPSASSIPAPSMVHIGVGMDDEDDHSDEYTQHGMESIAETGEPLVLCRLRRRAVELLANRLRDEKILHESRESELKEQLDELRKVNEKLVQELDSLKSSSSLSSSSSDSSSSAAFNGVRRSIVASIVTTLIITSSLIAYFIR